MSDLVVVSYKGEDTADQVLNKLREMQKEYLIDLEDACVVVRNKDGKVRLKQAINLIGTGAVSGATWGGLFGSLIGLLFLNPLLGFITGVAFGAGAGALSGALADYGINDDFIRSLGQSIEPGSSALFVLVRRVTLDKVLPELAPFGGKILKTSLSTEQEKRLRQAVEEMDSGPVTV
jgi:uncharacterized membrane protein